MRSASDRCISSLKDGSGDEGAATKEARWRSTSGSSLEKRQPAEGGGGGGVAYRSGECREDAEAGPKGPAKRCGYDCGCSLTLFAVALEQQPHAAPVEPLHQPRDDHLAVAPPNSHVLRRQQRRRGAVRGGAENDGGGVGDEHALWRLGGAESGGELQVARLPLVLHLSGVVERYRLQGRKNDGSDHGRGH